MIQSSIFKTKKNQNLKLQKNVLLSHHTTFRIGGSARYFFCAKSERELLLAIEAAQKEGLPFFVLGGGSNVLFSDNGFNGLVIKCEMDKIKISENGKIQVEAGVLWNDLVLFSAKNNLSGLEWGAGIPGTVGGAVRGNAGAYGHSISEFVEEVKIFNNEKIEMISVNDCGFKYRESIFKKNKNLIVLSVVFKLQAGSKDKGEKKINEILAARNEKIPSFPSAGSFFKNIILAGQSENFKKMIPLEKIRAGKVAAAYLIEECGLKGKKIGGAQISEKHANFIVNAGGATARDILALADLCKEEVKKKFGVELEEEVKIVGLSVIPAEAGDPDPIQ